MINFFRTVVAYLFALCFLSGCNIANVSSNSEWENTDSTHIANNTEDSIKFKWACQEFSGIFPKCRTFRYSKQYRLNEHSFPIEFEINIAIRKNESEYIRDFINKNIHDDISYFFGDCSEDTIVFPHIPLYNINDGDITQMSRYYYKYFCRFYKAECLSLTDPGETPFGPENIYKYYAYPVWENSDRTLVTWYFYRYNNHGGTHGDYVEFFLTFNNKSGRILGASDFYSENEFNEAIDVLTRQLNAYHKRDPYGKYSFKACLDDEYNSSHFSSQVYNETIGEEIYPRPAMTRKGIVFTYQMYEKGCLYDGILHFTQPYKNK